MSATEHHSVATTVINPFSHPAEGVETQRDNLSIVVTELEIGDFWRRKNPVSADWYVPRKDVLDTFSAMLGRVSVSLHSISVLVLLFVGVICRLEPFEFVPLHGLSFGDFLVGHGRRLVRGPKLRNRRQSSLGGGVDRCGFGFQRLEPSELHHRHRKAQRTGHL